jgi:hypothetical protein
MRSVLGLGLMFGLLLVPGLAGAGDSLTTYANALRQKAAELKQTPAQLRWQQIPWLTDLDEGVRLARLENRPLMLWTSGDDPLGRC